jgi:hypothetical protein
MMIFCVQGSNSNELSGKINSEDVRIWTEVAVFQHSSGDSSESHRQLVSGLRLNTNIFQIHIYSITITHFQVVIF